jgi:lysophospholipase L1-like esterase
VSVGSTDGGAVAVTFGSATVTGGTAPLTTTCNPASGNMFSVGASTVTCTTTDAQQRTDSCTFTVTVTPPPRLVVNRFLAFGDSITWGEDGNGIAPFGRSLFGPRAHVAQPYPELLRLALTSRYTAQTSSIQIRNEGVPGESVATGLDPSGPRRLTSVLAGSNYEIVLIMEGANDLQTDNDPKDIGPAIDGLRYMVRDVKSRGMVPILGTLPPENHSGRLGLPAPLVPQFNAALQSMAQGEGVLVADVYAAFNGDLSLLGADGLHPNQAGYQKVADAFFAVIKANFEEKTPAASLSPFGLGAVRRH